MMTDMYRVGFILIFQLPLMLWAQDWHTLEGRVVDSNGEPLHYVNVMVDSMGTSSNINGNFSLTLKQGVHQIKFSLIGYQIETKTINIPTKAPLLIVLQQTAQQLGDVVVTATRTNRKLDDVPVPVTVINDEQIQRMGALRLNEVLQEQTGLQMTSDHGTGLMMQGLPSEFILILLDGEPIIGRTAGTLDLERLSVDNIKQIEIIRGPSSSLYGSEALAGVINIITKESDEGFHLGVRSRVRSFGTSDVGINTGFKTEKFSTHLFLNRLSSKGYDLNESTISQTVPPFEAYTINPKFSWDITDAIKVSLNSRFYTEQQENQFEINQNAESFNISEKGKREDWSIMPNAEILFNDRHRLNIRSYTTQYKTEMVLNRQNDGSLHDADFFNQLFNRSELQHDWYISDQHILTLGLGRTYEKVEATRFDGLNIFHANYGFAQHQWSPDERFNIILGGRFDTHSAYASRFSPKIALAYSANKWLKAKASFGGGYKAPDFRQLLLNFTNPVIGYTVIGSNLIRERIEQLQNEGRISAILIAPSTMEQIQAEHSIAFNLSLETSFNDRFMSSINLFRNEINNMIDTAPIAIKTNNQNVFSYFNFDEVVTQGIEFNSSYRPSASWEISGGYQYLDSRNLEDVEAIKNEQVFRRNTTTNQTELVRLTDYGGLPNRSKHSGNFKVFYKNMMYDFDVALRWIYRGRWGTGDNNGNGLIDASSEFADGYSLINIALNKQLYGQFRMEGGVNNLTGITHPFDPSLAGRIWFIGLNWQLN